MLKNYFKIAWRNFIRDKFYTSINILGLSIGMGCLVLILLFITDELSYDTFHEQADQIHLVGREAQYGKNISKGLSTPYPLGSTIKLEIPEVEDYIVTMWPGPGMVSRDSEDPKWEDDIIMSTPGFFEIFSFPLKSGNPENVLSKAESVVLTEKMAQKYFPGENPIGKRIRIQYYGNQEYTVTGVSENIDENSYVKFDFVTSMIGNSSAENNRNSWGASMFHTFIKLKDDAGWDQVKPKMADIVDTHIGREQQTTFFSIPITKLYLSEYIKAPGFKGDLKYIYIFSAIAFFVLLLACINYMNLATARGMQRTREVGIRKALGAYRSHLVRQFLLESVLTTIAAFLFGLILAEFTLPYFNEFVGKSLTLNIYDSHLSSLFGIALLVGLLSGSYPAFFLSRFHPSRILKGENHLALSGASFRKLLVVIQFAVSTVLIICTLSAFNQLNYVLQKDLGFEEDQVMYVPVSQIQDQIETFKQNIQQHSAVISASATNVVPGRFNYKISQPFDPKMPEKKFAVHIVKADANFADVLGLELVAGRYFDEERITDSDQAMVINEAMVKELGWGTPKEVIGRELNSGAQIIGVVKDFHFQTLHHKIGPVLIQMESDGSKYYQNVALRFVPGQAKNLIEYLSNQWEEFGASSAPNYYFLDEQFAKQYETDRKMSQAFMVFTGITLFIACIGLLGLAAFAAERRIKEIGIRKVLGADIKDIIELLSKDFLLLVLIGFLVAIPISWFAINQWLQNFAYRVEVGFGVFLIAGFVTVVISLTTVSWQAVRAALANPINSLRSE